MVTGQFAGMLGCKLHSRRCSTPFGVIAAAIDQSALMAATTGLLLHR